MAKTALKREAAERLRQEYKTYELLLPLQGIVIPLVYGLYDNTSEAALVLILSYAGTALVDFECLSLKDRYVSPLMVVLVLLKSFNRKTLMSHLIRIQRTGIQHGDFEPRTVVHLDL